MTNSRAVHPFSEDERLRKVERLLHRYEFKAVQQRGGRYVTSHLVVFVAHGAQPWSRIGLTVSRKVGGAVVRNRIKRHLREAFRRNKRELPLGYDIVVIVRTRAAAADYPSIVGELIEASGRALGRVRPEGPKVES